MKEEGAEEKKGDKAAAAPAAAPEVKKGITDEQQKELDDVFAFSSDSEVTLEATFNGRGKNPWGQEVAGFSAETEINRKDWGLEWNVSLESGGVLVGEKIKIHLDVEVVAPVPADAADEVPADASA